MSAGITFDNVVEKKSCRLSCVRLLTQAQRACQEFVLQKRCFPGQAIIWRAPEAGRLTEAGKALRV
jgi:hypothetical protein